MEVASMLAGEKFSDEPRCVCPVIAEFLRTYNDQVDDARRQDLFEYASLVVDTRDDVRGERRRANICLDAWLAAASPKRMELRRAMWKLSPGFAARDVEIAHRAARWAAGSPARHEWALQLVEAMTGRRPVRAADAARADAARADAARADAARADAGAPDAGAADAGAPDTGIAHPGSAAPRDELLIPA